jgi:HEAT repeat protein
VNKSGWSSQEIEAKRAAVVALAEIGNPQAIGNLEKILKSASIFNRGALNKLKVEIIRSFDRYPAEAASRTLLAYVEASSDDLAKAAQEALKSLRGKVS